MEINFELTFFLGNPWFRKKKKDLAHAKTVQKSLSKEPVSLWLDRIPQKAQPRMSLLVQESLNGSCEIKFRGLL
jgi:hypothetical protein